MKKFICLLFIIFSSYAAAGDIYQATVKTIMMDKGYGQKAYIELNKKLIQRDDAVCHSSGTWEYVLDTSTAFGEKIYSNLLVAYTAQKPANFYGTDACLHTGIEELRRLELLN